MACLIAPPTREGIKKGLLACLSTVRVLLEATYTVLRRIFAVRCRSVGGYAADPVWPVRRGKAAHVGRLARGSETSTCVQLPIFFLRQTLDPLDKHSLAHTATARRDTMDQQHAYVVVRSTYECPLTAGAKLTFGKANTAEGVRVFDSTAFSEDARHLVTECYSELEWRRYPQSTLSPPLALSAAEDTMYKFELQGKQLGITLEVHLEGAPGGHCSIDPGTTTKVSSSEHGSWCLAKLWNSWERLHAILLVPKKMAASSIQSRALPGDLHGAACAVYMCQLQPMSLFACSRVPLMAGGRTSLAKANVFLACNRHQ